MNTFANIASQKVYKDENQVYDSNNFKCRFCLKYYKGYNCCISTFEYRCGCNGNLFLPPCFCCTECMYKQTDIIDIDDEIDEIDEIVTESLSAFQMAWMFSTINHEDLICNLCSSCRDYDYKQCPDCYYKK